ncbi:MAG: hypothetical protein P8N92_06935, partial [Burkholderiales bacterium]|nr:hypothetical protein [Burkholderiales bacterium]
MSARFATKIDTSGVSFDVSDFAPVSVERLVDMQIKPALALALLIMEDVAQIQDGVILLPWSEIYALDREGEYEELKEDFGLPRIKKVKLVMSERGTVADKNFNIFINSVQVAKKSFPFDVARPIIQMATETILIDQASWELSKELIHLGETLERDKNQEANEKLWGELRPFALNASAELSPYLKHTLVLTPKSLQLKLNKVDVFGTPVVEIEPSFNDAPNGWIETFDRIQVVPSHYDLTDGTGRIRVIISAPVREVLTRIKEDFPGRRAAGESADRFLKNVNAALGEEASSVLDEKQVEAERERIGIGTTSFHLTIQEKRNTIVSVTLAIDTTDAEGVRQVTREEITSGNDLVAFVEQVSSQLKNEAQFFRWKENLIDVDGDTERKLERARIWADVWAHQIQSEIQFDDIFTLSQYAPSVEGIGIAKPIYSAYIQRKGGDDTPWI